jgi:tetratricopeptide (TPR) repeat protein
MTFDQIMEEITLGLKGEPKEDLQYLMGQQEKYKSHEYSEEITRAIGRIIYDTSPEELRNDFLKLFENHELSVNKTIEEADFQIFRKNNHKALEIMETLIKNIENANWYKDDKVNEYYCFNNLLEEMLYKEVYKPKKELRKIPENYAGVYFRYGEILFELGKYNEAKAAIETAIKYNPIFTDILFELSEIYKMDKDWENYLKINNKCMDYAYSINALARCYRNLGYYYIEKNNYELATALFNFSLIFAPEHKNAQSELYYISQKTGMNTKEINMDNIIELLNTNNIRIGANKLVLSIAYSIGKAAKNENNIDMAKYYFGIVYELTGDSQIIKEFESI